MGRVVKWWKGGVKGPGGSGLNRKEPKGWSVSFIEEPSEGKWQPENWPRRTPQHWLIGVLLEGEQSEVSQAHILTVEGTGWLRSKGKLQ